MFVAQPESLPKRLAGTLPFGTLEYRESDLFDDKAPKAMRYQKNRAMFEL